MLLFGRPATHGYDRWIVWLTSRIHCCLSSWRPSLYGSTRISYWRLLTTHNTYIKLHVPTWERDRTTTHTHTYNEPWFRTQSYRNDGTRKSLFSIPLDTHTATEGWRRDNIRGGLTNPMRATFAIILLFTNQTGRDEHGTKRRRTQRRRTTLARWERRGGRIQLGRLAWTIIYFLGSLDLDGFWIWSIRATSTVIVVSLSLTFWLHAQWLRTHIQCWTSALKRH